MRILYILLLIAIGCKGPAPDVKPEPVASAPDVKPEPVANAPDVKPEPVASAPDVKPTPKNVVALADGILRIKEKRDHGLWFMCGKELDAGEKAETALRIALGVTTNVESLGAEFSSWGVVGTMFNESRFDPCALGRGPRHAAYGLKLLKPRKRGITHTRGNILKAIADPRMVKRFKRSGYDLGFCQILTRFYPGEVVDMVTVDAGIRICVLEMYERSKANDTIRPWLYWRGHKAEWYRTKIRRNVKTMKGELGEI